MAQAAQQKFDFYVVGLTFTVLAASIHTAEFDVDWGVPAALELLSWIALLVAGLLGLWRLEWMPQAIQIERLITGHRDTQLTFAEAKAKGHRDVLVAGSDARVSIDDLIAERTRAIESLDAERKALDESFLLPVYRVARWFFIIGMTLLVIARAYRPIANLVAGFR